MPQGKKIKKLRGLIRIPLAGFQVSVSCTSSMLPNSGLCYIKQNRGQVRTKKPQTKKCQNPSISKFKLLVEVPRKFHRAQERYCWSVETVQIFTFDFDQPSQVLVQVRGARSTLNRFWVRLVETLSVQR